MDSLHRMQNFLSNYFHPIGEKEWDKKSNGEKWVAGAQVFSYCTILIPIFVGLGYAILYGAEKAIEGMVGLKNRVSLSLQRTELAAKKAAGQRKKMVHWNNQVNVKEWNGEETTQSVKPDQRPSKPERFYSKSYQELEVTNEFKKTAKIVKGKKTQRQVLLSYSNVLAEESHRKQMEASEAGKDNIAAYNEQGIVNLTFLTVAFAREMARKFEYAAPFLAGIFENVVEELATQIEQGRLSHGDALEKFENSFLDQVKEKNAETLEFDRKSFARFARSPHSCGRNGLIYSLDKFNALVEEFNSGAWKNEDLREMDIKYFNTNLPSVKKELKAVLNLPSLRSALEIYFREARAD
jgi:hypothetical protein